MIQLVQAMLVQHVRESETGHEVMNPINLMWVDDVCRSDAPIDFLLKCIALVYVRGGRPDEEMTVTGTIRGPDVPGVVLTPQKVRWRDKARIMDLILGIDLPVKMSTGGLYELKLQLNGRPLATLPFFLVWKSEERAP